MRGLLRIGAVVLAVLGGVPATVAAQGESPKPFVYSTYFECATGEQWKADGVMAALEPSYAAVVAGGKASSWGWMEHHTGGKWRRAMYYAAPTLEALLAVPDGVDAEVEKAEKTRESEELSRICPAHEDYIWRVVSGSGGGQLTEKRGKVGFSVYMICDESREERADELFATVYAPLYAQHVASGTLATWGYLQHWVGGEYRRLITLTAADLPSLMKARDGVVEKSQTDSSEAVAEFSSICNGHQDYIWEITAEKP